MGRPLTSFACSSETLMNAATTVTIGPPAHAPSASAKSGCGAHAHDSTDSLVASKRHWGVTLTSCRVVERARRRLPVRHYRHSCW